MELVGGTCRCTVVTSPTTFTSMRRMAGCATASTTRCGSLASFEKRHLPGAGKCLPVTDSHTVTAHFGGRMSIWNSSLGNYWVRVSSSERIACYSGRVRLDRAGRGRRGSSSVGREFGASRSRRLLQQRDGMDCAMLHLMDTAPFRGVSQAPSRVRDAGDSMVPMAFFRFGKSNLPDVVQAGDPVLHEPAEEVMREDIGSARIEKAINDMVDVMRAGPGVGLAAPQIGIPLQIIVLEDTKELMSYTSPEECEAQQRTPFDLLVILNPKLEMKASGGTAFFFEGCLSIAGHRALVERHLEVEVAGLGRDGQPLHFTAKGWKARILQHEYDHLQGLLYVDQMVKRTFRTTDNLRLPLPSGCPRPGVGKTPTCT